MKILAFSDAHSDLEAIKKLASKAKEENIDLLLCAGDISEFGDRIGQIFKALDIDLPMIYIPGNHEEEGSDISKQYKYIKNIHKKSLDIDGVLFLGCGGGGFSKFFTAFERLMPVFSEKIKEHSGPVILVTHAPPYKTKLDRMGVMDVGSEPIKKFIEKEQPTYAISGHIHENEGKKDKIGKTILINPGKKGLIVKV